MNKEFIFQMTKIAAITFIVSLLFIPDIIAENNKKYCVTNFKNITDVETCIKLVK